MRVEFNWVKPQKSIYGNAAFKAVVTRKSKSGRQSSSGEQTYQLSVIIPEDLMKEARFVLGDRVEVGFGYDSAKGRCIALRRVPVGGYTITSSKGGGRGDAAKLKGSIGRGRVQVTYGPGMHDEFSSQNGGYEFSDSGMLVIWEGVK